MNQIKKIFILIVSLIICKSLILYGQWTTLHYINDTYPLPDINSISFIDVNNGMGACRGMISYNIGGQNSSTGSIIKTTDGGVTWSNVYTMDSIIFNQIIHIGINTVISVGYHYYSTYGIIAKSTNSGISWDTLTFSNALNSVSFLNNNIGYISGSNGSVYKTIDGGNQWSQLITGVTENLLSCLFLNDTVGFVGGGTKMMKTTNGGQTWVIQNYGLSYEGIVDICFPSNNIGYFILVPSNRIYKTIDNGGQWSFVSTTNDFPFLSSIYFPNELIGYMTGQFRMYKTTDGGINWYRQYASPPSSPNFMDDVSDLFFLNVDTGFAAGSSQFYRTFHGGDSTNSSINELKREFNKINVYPIPFNRAITFMFGYHNEKYTISLYDINGHMIEKIEDIVNERYILINKNISSGTIFYCISDDLGIITTGKLIVE